MSLVQVPNSNFDNVDNVDCNSVDIYLFSNGQQQSPPRKYHFQVDELIKWEPTLQYIAESQYGKKCSLIHLYTTMGQKIESPIEIENGIAYVAVLPEDSFINTGYNEYLIKASRSRDKRLEKSKPQNISRLQPSNNIADQYIANDDTKRNKKSILVVTDNNKNSRARQRNSYAVNGKKIYHNTSLKPHYSAIPTEIPKNSLQSKHGFSKKIMNTRKTDNKAPTANNNLRKLISKAINKTGQRKNICDGSQKKKEIKTTLDNTDFDIDPGKNTTKLHKIDSSDVIEHTDNKVNEFVKAILSSIVLSMPINGIELTKDTNTDNEDPKIFTDYMNKNDESPNKIENINTSVETENIVELDNKPFSQGPKKAKELTSGQTVNFISIMDKGDIIDLNLKMQITKGDGIITANYLCEKSSQVEFKEIIPQPLENELKSTNNGDIENSEEECACEECYELDEIIHKINNTNMMRKKFVFLLNNSTIDQIKRSCNCGSKIFQNNSQINYLYTPLKTQDDVDAFFETENSSAVENCANVENMTKAIGHTQSTINLECEQRINCDFCMISISTQTEWSSLLVEARHREDNRYSFHLPSLQALKEYFS
ncbi:hypothetical protein ACJJTC_010269 [Scirpophaga incertulas]